jgi:nucleoside-diphosphate-sugar epimerase
MKLVLGAGYLGMRVAKRWQASGHEVAALTRTAARTSVLQAQGIRPLLGDVTTPATLVGLPACETILFAVGYDRSCGKTHQEVYVEGLRNVLAALANSSHEGTLHRLIYISTTGVYAASEQDVVDEQSPCQPTTPGAIAHFEAEQILRDSPFANRAIILRMAGLYGEERVPRIDDLRAGRPIAAASDGWVNLIHVDDAAETVLAAEAKGAPSQIYNVADGQPANRRDYLNEVARLVGAPPPVFVEPNGDAATSRGAASKRISNRRMMAELKVALRYPSFREGLAACF